MSPKRALVSLLLLLAVAPLAAQRIFRTEFAPHDTREDALRRSHASTENYIAFKPQRIDTSNNLEAYVMSVDIPTAWSDFNVFLHLENLSAPYYLFINNDFVATVRDPKAYADFFISRYLRQGRNDVMLAFEPMADELNGAKRAESVPFAASSYIFAQYRRYIYDYDASIALAENGKNLNLALDLLVRNDFNFEEPVKVGYDIYDPSGKLVDYAIHDMIVPGRTTDTLRVRTNLGAEARYLWSAAKPQLYRMTLYVKRDGKPREYVLFHLGAGTTGYADGKITRNGQPLTLRTTAYEGATTFERTQSELRALKKQGFNTVLPHAPQPTWFYDICDREGLYVVERANINPTHEPDNRAVGGTPSNNPALADEYLERVKAMYYRTRNHSCIIAYALGGDRSGNGYNMYKAYEWLKSVEPRRAVITPCANGEWNTDIDSLK